MKIEDGRGKYGDAGVSADQRLDVSARSAERAFYSARDDGLAYSVTMDAMTLAAGDIAGYLKNTSSTRNLIINDMDFSGVPAGKWIVSSCSGTAAAGTAVTPTNLNLSKGNAAEASAMSGDTSITGLTAIATIGVVRHEALGQQEENFSSGLILGPSDAIMIEYDTGAGGLCEIVIDLHYEDTP